jgi:hypothetical protein
MAAPIVADKTSKGVVYRRVGLVHAAQSAGREKRLRSMRHDAEKVGARAAKNTGPENGKWQGRE